MKLSPIKKKRVYQEIIEQIKFAIERGEINPGDKLPSERKLADDLSVSRTSVKEAISVLDSTGIVDIQPGIGVFLRNRTANDIVLQMDDILTGQENNIIEIMEMRQAIEGDAAYYAAKRSGEKEREAIKKALDKLEQAVKENRVAAEEDFEFHLAICKAAQNSLITRVMYLISDVLLDGLIESRSKTLKVSGLSEKIVDEHKEIYSAIINSNAENARDLMVKHLQGVRDRYVK